MKFECPYCGAKYEESQDVSGQEGECVECGRRFVATPMQESPDDTNAMFSEMRRVCSGSSVSGVISILLIVFAVIVAGTGIASFNDSFAQSAIHQIFFALRTLAYLAGAIIILLIAILVKMK